MHRKSGVSEARFRAFADHVQDAFYLHDEKGVVLDVNQRACDMLGYTREELIGLHPRDFDASDIGHAFAYIQSQLAKGKEARFDTYHRRKDGSLFPVEVRLFPYEEGGRSLRLALVSDISARKQAEETTQRLSRELQAISDCHQVLLRADDEQKLLDDICRIICDKTGYRLAWAGFVEHDAARSIRPASWAGHDSGYIKDIGLSWAEDSPYGQGPSGIAVRSGDFVYAQDIATDPRMAPWREEALKRGYRSSITMPLKGDDGEVFGVLVIYSSKVHAFSEAEIRLLRGLADDLAFGINVLRLREDRELAEESLQLNEQRYSTIFLNSPLGLFTSTVEGKFLGVNPALADILGYASAEEMIHEIKDIGRQIYADPEGRQKVVAEQMQAPGNVMQYTQRFLRKDGTVRIANLYLKTIRDAEGTPMFFDGIVEDITERVRVEEALRSSEEKYRTIFENSPLGIFRSNIKEHRYVEVNPALATFLGYDSSEQMIREVVDIGKQIYANPAEREEVVARQLRAPGDVMQHLCHYKRRDGSKRMANLYLKTIRDTEGNPAFFEGIVEDITERVQFEIALQEKSEELYQLNMELRKLSAHQEEIIEQERTRISQDLHDELGQNLTALLMSISTLKAIGGDLNEDMRHGLDHARGLVDKSMNKAREIVSQLRPKSIDMGLSDSLESLIDSYCSNTGIQCELELMEWDDSLVNDAATISLYRVVQESLTNVARYAQTDNVVIVLSGQNGVCQLIVRDEGVGFDPKRIKENSFGLLGIRERIANLGGSFVIDTKKGKGTELRVTLQASSKRDAT